MCWVLHLNLVIDRFKRYSACVLVTKFVRSLFLLADPLDLLNLRYNLTFKNYD